MRRPEGYDEIRHFANRGGVRAGTAAHPSLFPGPAGRLEGSGRSRREPRGGSAVFAHPHPLHGGTLHNKVVYRAAQALTRAGYATLRFNFRGVGLSEGRLRRRAAARSTTSGPPWTRRRGGAACRSSREASPSGPRWRCRRSAGDPRIGRFIGLGLPLATVSGRVAPAPVRCRRSSSSAQTMPSGLPRMLKRFLGTPAGSSSIPERTTSSTGCLDARARSIARFLHGPPSGRAAERGVVTEHAPLSEESRRDLLSLARGTLEAHFRREPRAAPRLRPRGGLRRGRGGSS